MDIFLDVLWGSATKPFVKTHFTNIKLFDVYCLHIGIIQNEIEAKKLIWNALHRQLCMPHNTTRTPHINKLAYNL